MDIKRVKFAKKPAFSQVHPILINGHVENIETCNFGTDEYNDNLMVIRLT